MRLGVIADVHGNLPALEAVIADMAGRRLDAVVNLGDCVSGPLWPRETLDLLQAKNWPTVRGNHDRAVGTGRSVDLGPSDAHAAAALDDAGRAWLADLPRHLELDGNIVAFHSRPDADDAYLIEDQWGGRLMCAAPDTIRRRLGNCEARVVLTGHSHRQASLRLPEGPWLVNPGSVGCPAYDDDATDPPHVSESGSSAARYAVLDLQGDAVTIEALALGYAHEMAAARAEANGRPDWAAALRTGFMPAKGYA